jgi:hypothetical protein
MKNIILILSIISLIIASIWMYVSNFDFEPILMVLGLVGVLLGYYWFDNKQTDASSSLGEKAQNSQNNTHTSNISVVNNISPQIPLNTIEELKVSEKKNNFHLQSKDEIIEIMKKKIKILFIDDDSGFNIVKILKDSGWVNASTTKDIKSIDIPQVKSATVLFIDNHGVGKLLNCKDEGLDLVKMIKEKYPEKIVVIYSGDMLGNMFHEAINLANHRLAKNALPYEFQKIIETASINLYNKN